MSNHDDPNDSTQYSTKGCYGDFYQAILNHQCRRSSLDAPGKITKNPPEMKNAQQISSPELCFLSHCYCKATVPLPLSPRPACSLVFNAWLSVSFGNRNTIVTLSRSKADLRLYDWFAETNPRCALFDICYLKNKNDTRNTYSPDKGASWMRELNVSGSSQNWQPLKCALQLGRLRQVTLPPSVVNGIKKRSCSRARQCGDAHAHAEVSIDDIFPLHIPILLSFLWGQSGAVISHIHLGCIHLLPGQEHGQESDLLCMFLFGSFVEETPCEHGENMSTPHRTAREMGHRLVLSWAKWESNPRPSCCS